MFKRFFEKYETLMCILLIVLYLVINAFCVNSFGSDDYRSALINTAFSAVLIIIAVSLKRVSYYGLTKPQNTKKLLYFIPLALIVSVNLWTGININQTASQILAHTLVMFNVGFAEEIIFRGFLFKMMEKDNVKTAVIVSSLTFGIGHIVNLFNGNDLVPTLLQVCYATSIGYLFVVIFRKSKSLIPCIAAHALNNSLSVFIEKNSLSVYLIPVFLIVAPLLYAVYINKTVKEQKSPDERPIE